jgi:putative Mg2+ transporter-C (MgtC) family protein
MTPSRFFGLVIDPASLGGKTAVLLLAVLLGGLIGLERELRGQAAGLRTHILVCVGATLMTLTSIEIGYGGTGPARGDPARLAAQIVTGIGFLGAGAIIRDGMTIHGLTTAASIWTTAGIGIALGAGPRLGQVAVITTLIVLATLTVLNRLEDRLHAKQRRRTLEVEVREADHGPARLLALLAENGFRIYGVQMETRQALSEGASGAEVASRQMRIQVRLPGKFERDHFNRLLAEEPGVVSFYLD